MGYINMIDLSGAYALEDIIKNAESKSIKVIVVNANTNIKQILSRVDFIKNIGEDNYKDSKDSIPPIISEHFI